MTTFHNLRLCALMTFCLLCSGVWAQTTEPYYTLVPIAGGQYNTYDSNNVIECNGLNWNILGYTKMVPWRIGGKSIQAKERVVFSKTPMGSAISKVNLGIGAAESIMVNSLKLIIANDENFINIVDEVSGTFKANSTIVFEPQQLSKWETGVYYKFVFNVTIEGNTNQFLEFVKAEFYTAPSGAEKWDAGFSFPQSVYTISKGATFDAPVLTTADGYDGDIHYSMSGDDNVAAVNEQTGDVTLLGGLGRVTVIATADATEHFKIGRAEYILEVVEDIDLNYQTYEAFLFEETFSNTEMGKDNDGSNFDFQTARSPDESSGDKFADNQGWTFENGYQSVKCVKLGTESKAGKATTPKLGKAGNLILTFNAGAYNLANEKTGLELSVNGGGTLDQKEFILTKGAWGTYTAIITGATAETAISFAALDKKNANRFFLDNVIVKAEMPVTDDNTDVLNNGTTTKVLEDEEDSQSVYYMTYVTKFDVDMRNSKDVDAYVVTGLNENESALAMQKVNFIPANTALLLKVTQNEEFAMYKSPMSITADEALNSNLLHAGQGEVVGEGVCDAYGLGIVGGKAGFYRIQNGVKIPENKAYLLLADYGVNDAKTFYGFHGDGETMAIGQTADGGTDGVSVYYNVQGQQVKNPIHGIYIVNGKKIWIK